MQWAFCMLDGHTVKLDSCNNLWSSCGLSDWTLNEDILQCHGWTSTWVLLLHLYASLLHFYLSLTFTLLLESYFHTSTCVLLLHFYLSLTFALLLESYFCTSAWVFRTSTWASLLHLYLFYFFTCAWALLLHFCLSIVHFYLSLTFKLLLESYFCTSTTGVLISAHHVK